MNRDKKNKYLSSVHDFLFFYINLANLVYTSASKKNMSFNLLFYTIGLSCSSSILISSKRFKLFYVLISMSTPTISSVNTTPNTLRLIQGASGLG